MIRISLLDNDDALVLKLEGCLSGQWASEANASWRELMKTGNGRRISVDLQGICHVDDRGRELMSVMHRDGAHFMVSGCVMPEVVREISESVPVRHTVGGRK